MRILATACVALMVATPLNSIIGIRAAVADESACSTIQSVAIAPSVSALPISAVTVTAAQPMPASAGLPAFCKVLGKLMPMDKNSWPILFEVNLPDTWNQKAVQMGGGGTNGVLVTGLSVPQIVPSDTPSLLSQGYATYGTDAGHPMFAPDPQLFAANQEAVVNQAFASYKKVHDIAVHIIEDFYQRPMLKTYFFGYSEGGREAMILAQRYPKDYDGVIAVVPAMNWTGQHLAHYNEWLLQQQGGWLNAAKVKLLADAVLKSCDELDGLKDGIIGHYERCGQVFEVRKLRCPKGADTGDGCLSDAQIKFVNAIHQPFHFAFPIANGLRFYPGSLYGGEAQQGGIAGSLMVTKPPKSGDLGRPLPGPGSVRFFFAQDPNFTGPLDMRKYRDRILELSRLYDPTDPDLTAFAQHGKLLLVENGSDYVKSPLGSLDYYQSVVAKMGKASTDQFFDAYLNPGVNHGDSGVMADGSAIPSRIDLLSVLDQWSETGKPPGDLVVTSPIVPNSSVPVVSRPLCRFPSYPRYAGQGDVKAASSFVCADQ